MKYTLVQFTSAPEYMSCYKWLPILVFKNKYVTCTAWYKTLAWWVIFRCQYTLTSNNQLWGCLNPPCLVLFSAVDVVAKHSSVNKTTLNAGSRFPKAFVSSAGILNLPISSIPVDDFNDRALWCKPTGINYNIHGWILCRYCATGWFWWIHGLRAVTMWSSSSFTTSTVTSVQEWKLENEREGRYLHMLLFHFNTSIHKIFLADITISPWICKRNIVEVLFSKLNKIYFK